MFSCVLYYSMPEPSIFSCIIKLVGYLKRLSDKPLYTCTASNCINNLIFICIFVCCLFNC